MKNTQTKIANFLKIGTLLLGFSLLLWNCEKDEINYTENINVKCKLEYSVEQIHFNDLIDDFEFQKSLKTIKSKFFNKKEQQKTHNKSTTQINDDLVLLIDKVNRVVTNYGVITWTFQTKKPVFKDSDFENFVVKKQNNEFSYYLITYKHNLNVTEEGYESIKSYKVREEYLTLDNLNLSARGDVFDWVDPDTGGGTNESCTEIYTEVKACDSGGRHSKTFACQHVGGIHGVSNTPPCDDVCSGTETVTIIDYSNCDSGTYDPPGGPSNTLPDGDAGSQPTGGGSSSGSGDSTVTSPIGITDNDTSCDPAPKGDLNGDCMLDFDESHFVIFLNNLDIKSLSFLNTNSNLKAVIFNFNATKKWSPDAQTFAELVVKTLAENPDMTIEDVDFEDRIINELIGEAKCIFKKLKTLDLYKGTIKKFENSDYDLIITYGDFNGEAYTDDEFIDLGIIQIKVPGLNNTYLGFAATLLHEGIHAELFKYVHERNNGVDVNDRPNLMHHYFQLKGAVDPRYFDAMYQHEHMADKYVKPIAEAIRELDNNRYPLDHYWGFAWEGLKDYGYNQYFDSDSGNLINLDDTGFNQKQALVNSTSPFNTQNCN